MVDLVSISFAKSLGLSPCTKRKHQHTIPNLEGVGETHPQTYGFFQFNRSLHIRRPFLAVDRNARDSQILLGRPALKDFKINICNGNDSWEFQRQPKVTVVSPKEFARELTPRAQVFEGLQAY
jgi:hypothetical protein